VTTVLLKASRGSAQYQSMKSRMAWSYARCELGDVSCSEPLIATVPDQEAAELFSGYVYVWVSACRHFLPNLPPLVPKPEARSSLLIRMQARLMVGPATGHFCQRYSAVLPQIAQAALLAPQTEKPLISFGLLQVTAALSEPEAGLITYSGLETDVEIEFALEPSR
jgi:hypothetical protein